MEQEQNTNKPVRTLDASVSFITAAVLLILTVFVGGFFFLYGDKMGVSTPEPVSSNTRMMPGTPEEIAATEAETNAATTALSTQGTSDELGAIEADLNATDFSSLEDIDQI